MEDVLTEAPPPSRFLPEDIDNFAAPAPSLPSPFLLKNPNPNPNPTRCRLFILLLSPAAVPLLPSPETLTLAASLFLPELPLSHPRAAAPINVYSLNLDPTTLIAAAACHVSPDRSKTVAKILLDEFAADRIVIFDSIKGENYRGRLAADEEEAAAFKLETREERRSGGLVRGVGPLGSGSLVDGMAAAVMGECEMRRRKGTLVAAVSTGGAAGKAARARVLMGVMREIGVEVGDFKGAAAAAPTTASSWLDSDLYT